MREGRVLPQGPFVGSAPYSTSAVLRALSRANQGLNREPSVSWSSRPTDGATAAPIVSQ